jgi:hypothetical protein
MEIELGLLIVLTIVICLTYKIKNAVLRWSLVVIPPLFIIPLYWVPWDILTCLFWIPAIIAFLWSLLSLIINIVRIIFRKVRKKPQINFVKLRFFRPALTVIIFLFVHFFVNRSLSSADKFAKETAIKIQAQINTSGECPKKIEDWESDKWDPNISIIMYGKYGTKYPVRYHTFEDGKEFEISVRHNIDEGFFVSGGINRALTAKRFGPGGSVEVPID